MGKGIATTVGFSVNYYTMEEKWFGWLGMGNERWTKIYGSIWLCVVER